LGNARRGGKAKKKGKRRPQNGRYVADTRQYGDVHSKEGNGSERGHLTCTKTANTLDKNVIREGRFPSTETKNG